MRLILTTNLLVVPNFMLPIRWCKEVAKNKWEQLNDDDQTQCDMIIMHLAGYKTGCVYRAKMRDRSVHCAKLQGGWVYTEDGFEYYYDINSKHGRLWKRVVCEGGNL